MKNKLTNNLGWKIVSLLISVMLWMVVNSISDPSVTQTFYNVPVKLVNTDQITSAGKVYKVLDGTDVAQRVTIKAPRSILSEITQNDILVTADVKNMNQLDNVPVTYDVSVYADHINSIKGSLDLVNLKVENKKTRTMSINVSYTGKMAEGYMLGDASLSQNVVRLSGAESVVDSVDVAKIDVDITGFTDDVKTNSDIKLYDADGNLVVDEDLNLNIKSVVATIDILSVKTIPVNYVVKTTPEPNYVNTGEIEATVNEVQICGNPEAVASIESIDIPSEDLDISGYTTDAVFKINLRNYLPEGLDFVGGSSSNSVVTVKIVPSVTKNIEISMDDVDIINVPEGYSATIAIDDGSSIELSGVAKSLENIGIESIKPVVDVENWMQSEDVNVLEEGFYTAQLTFTLPSDVSIKRNVKAVLHIVEKEE